MDIHYNAFISYRHHPDDIKVAADIHRGLERFKIPRAIKKRGGGTLRLFRDKEELPITSSLTSDIYRALENSDFLIVICSPHTRESIWVQREIETFLLTHSRDRVLTVLADGEPYDVLPEILLHEDVVDPVTGAVQRREYEPLSCDWRLKKRQAVREELPRLAAALLGCGYDELRQRQRQYRMRRMIALLSAALIGSMSLAAYYIHTSIQIQKANDNLHAANIQIQEANVQIQSNLDQALRNHSEYLASAAGDRLDAGDRLTAISLALAALPSEGNDRPYVPEAERALSEALNAYHADYQVAAQGAFPTDALVQQFIVSDDGKRIFIVDARMILTVWDTVTFQKLSTIDLSAYSVENLLQTASGNILIVTSSEHDMLLCYQPDGTFLWQAEHCLDMVFLDGRSRILMLQNDYQELYQYTQIDADTGEVLTAIPIVTQEQDSKPSQFLQQDVAPGQQVLVRYFSGNTDFLFLMELPTGTLRKVTQIDTSFSGDNYRIDCAVPDADGNIILMRGDSSGTYNGNYGTFQVTSPDRADLICYDAETLQIRWQSEITNHIYSNRSTICPIPDSSHLLIQSGDIIQIHDAASGELLSRCQLPAIPLHLQVDAQEAWGITQTGAYFSYSYADNLCYVTPFTSNSLDGAVVNGGYFVHVPLESHITVYRSMKDEDGTVYDEALSFLPENNYSNGNYLLAQGYRDLYLFDASRKSLLWNQDKGSSWDFLGFSEDGTRLWLVDKGEDCAVEISVADGSRTDIPLSLNIEDRITALESDFFLREDRLMYILETDGLTQLRQVDLNTGKETLRLELKELNLETINYSKTTEFLFSSESVAWIWRSETVYVIDLQTGALRQILSGISSKPACTWNSARRELLVAAGHELLLANPDGRITLRIDLESRRGVSVFCYGEQLLTLCDDGSVYRYDRQGKLLSRTTLELYNTFFSSISGSMDPMDIAWWCTDDGDLIIKAFRAGNIIDCGQWQSRAFIPYMYTYFPQLDEIVCFSENQFHSYSRYTTQQQMQKGREALGDFCLTEDQLRFYGLN